jgi:hypothetical protein
MGYGLVVVGSREIFHFILQIEVLQLSSNHLHDGLCICQYFQLFLDTI